MSQSVDRLKELLFDRETNALNDLAARIDELASREARGREEISGQLSERIAGEARLRADLLARLESIAELDAKARHEIAARLEEIYARAGNAEHLTASVAGILSDALRRAEVAQHIELSQSLAPLIVSTIKIELRNSQDEMVEALYPITGRLVKSYVASALKDLADQMNRRLEQNAFMLRLQSLTTGRPVAELALAGAQTFEIKGLYLIRRGSGELAAHWPESEVSGRDHAISGVLAAINEFANEAFSADEASLRNIDLGGETVYLRGSPVYLLAARCSGRAPEAFEQTIDDAFLSAVERQLKIDARLPRVADAAAAESERHAALADVGSALRTQLAADIARLQRPSGRGVLKALAALILLPLAGWYGWTLYGDYQTAETRRVAERIVAAEADMLGYPVEIAAGDRGRTLAVSGLTPSLTAKSRIVAALNSNLPRTEITDNLSIVAGSDIVVPDVAPEIARVREEISRAVTRVSQDARGRANARAAARLSEAVGDMKRAAETMKDTDRKAALTALADETAGIGQALALHVGEAMSVASEDASSASTGAAYAALTRRIEAANAQLLQTIGVNPQASERTPLAHQSPAAAPLDGAVEHFSAASERLAALAAAITAANALLPPPPALPPPVVIPGPSARDRLEIWTRRQAIFFGDNLEYRDAAGAAQALIELAGLLKGDTARLRIVGYTDESGGVTRNVQLARDRAEKVRGDLLNLGVPPEQLVTVGRANALDLSDSKGAASPNRRVQFEIAFEGEGP